MQKSNQLITLLQDNRCSDCLFMKIEGNPIKHGLLRKETEKLELYLTINFNEECKEISWGKVKFGIKSGELELTLENGKSPYELRHLINGPLVISDDKEIEIKQSSENKNILGSSLSKNKAGLNAKKEDKDKIEKTEKFKKTTYSIDTKGSEENPIWTFKKSDDEITIKGNLINQELATIIITKNTYGIRATFRVRKRDIHLTDIEGILPTFLHANKNKIIENLIVDCLFKKELTPYLSRTELRYE